MNISIESNRQRQMYTVAKYIALALYIAAIPSLAFAQSADFTQLNTTLSSIQKLLQGAGVTVVSVAIAWAGYKMIFQHARWADISTVVLGAILIGAAATIAQWLIPSG